MTPAPCSCDAVDVPRRCSPVTLCVHCRNLWISDVLRYRCRRAARSRSQRVSGARQAHDISRSPTVTWRCSDLRWRVTPLCASVYRRSLSLTPIEGFSRRKPVVVRTAPAGAVRPTRSGGVAALRDRSARIEPLRVKPGCGAPGPGVNRWFRFVRVAGGRDTIRVRLSAADALVDDLRD